MESDQLKVRKVFIDSSVLIAAAISPNGSARELIMGSFRNKYKIVISDLVLEETERNLSKKAPQALHSLQLFLEVLHPEVVYPSKPLVLNISKFIELKDAPIVAGAVASKSDYLVSFDRKHLLRCKREIEAKFKVKVLTPLEVI